jgi:hypothetical protein
VGSFHFLAANQERVPTMTRDFLLRAIFAGISAAALHGQTDWPSYGHDAGGMRFSPLKQINTSIDRLAKTRLTNTRLRTTLPGVHRQTPASFEWRSQTSRMTNPAPVKFRLIDPRTSRPRSLFRKDTSPCCWQSCSSPFLVAIRRRPSVRQLGYREGQPGTEALGPIASVK